MNGLGGGGAAYERLLRLCRALNLEWGAKRRLPGGAEAKMNVYQQAFMLSGPGFSAHLEICDGRADELAWLDDPGGTAADRFAAWWLANCTGLPYAANDGTAQRDECGCTTGRSG